MNFTREDLDKLDKDLTRSAPYIASSVVVMTRKLIEDLLFFHEGFDKFADAQAELQNFVERAAGITRKVDHLTVKE